jgi:hypothetical protein
MTTTKYPPPPHVHAHTNQMNNIFMASRTSPYRCHRCPVTAKSSRNTQDPHSTKILDPTEDQR